MLQRKTIVSTELMNIFERSSQPLSVNQLIEKLKDKGLTPNKSTIYRIVEKLKKQDTVTEIKTTNGNSYYELNKHTHHHHHFICSSCDTVYCLDQCHLDAFKINTKKLLPNQNFIIKSHEFNLHGICGQCSTN